MEIYMALVWKRFENLELMQCVLLRQMLIHKSFLSAKLIYFETKN